MSSFFTKLRALPDLLSAYTRLRADVESAMKDREVRDAWSRFRNDPAVSVSYPKISAEWRALEEAMQKMR